MSSKGQTSKTAMIFLIYSIMVGWIRKKKGEGEG